MARRETVAQAHARGQREGYESGIKQATSRLTTAVDVRRHQLELMASVTALVSAAGQSLQALAAIYDNGPRS